MDLYDIVAEGCEAGERTSALLGYKKILQAGRDFRMVDLDAKGADRNGASMLVSSDPRKLMGSADYGKFMVQRRLGPDRQLLSRIRDRDAVLCLPMENITLPYGLVRSRNIYLLRKTFAEAKSLGVRVSFASLAHSDSAMNSAVQLIELGKLIANDEYHVRNSLGTINKLLQVSE